MKWPFLGGLGVSLVVLAACGYAGMVLGSSQANSLSQSPESGTVRPVLGFDDSPARDPARPTLGFDDSPAPSPRQLPDPQAPRPVEFGAPPPLPLPYPSQDPAATRLVEFSAPLPPPVAPAADPAGGRDARAPGAGVQLLRSQGQAPSPAAYAMTCGPSCTGYTAHRAPSWDADESCEHASRIWLDADMLLWWIKDSRSPALVTTSPQTSLGVLGQPNTHVLYGGEIANDEYLGGRFRAGLWLDECRTWGAETGFFFLGQRSVQFNAASSGSPLLARPFFNAFTQAEDAEQVANLAVPSLPLLLPLTGRVGVVSTSRMWGLEANGVRELASGRTYHFELLGGFRYLRLDEALGVSEDLRVPASSPDSAGEHFQLKDDFGTRNNFYGGQLGARAELTRGMWSVGLLGEVALGDAQQLADIKGATRITLPGGAVQGFNGALLALPTNIGRHSRDRFAFLPEWGVNVGCQLTERFRLRAGYSLFYLSSVARPGDQIDRNVNSTQIPPNTLRGPALPAFSFHSTDFWAQGVNVGVEYDY
jgi:hypothetical protein